MRILTSIFLSIVILLSSGCYDNQNNGLGLSNNNETLPLFAEEKLHKLKNTNKELHETMVKVLNAPGYKNNMLVFDTKKYQYTIHVKIPKKVDPMFFVSREPIGKEPLSLYDTDGWAVNLDGKVDLYLDHKNNSGYDYFNVESNEPLTKKKAQELQQYYQKEHKKLVSLIHERY